MPDIFISGTDTVGDVAPQTVAEDPIPLVPQSTPLSSENKKISNAQKHAERKANKHNLPGHTHNVLASYFYYPDKVDFINKDPLEVVVLLVRRHPITNVPWVAMVFILIMMPAFLSIMPFFGGIPGDFQMVLTIIWYMLTVAFALEKFLGWFFNVNIVTDERVIDVDFVHLLYREMTDADIEQIQDVTVEMGGTIRTLFNYGDVLIQTASSKAKTRFEAIPHPDRVAKLLRELRVEEQEEEAEGRVR
jgi:membrane protein YdbS with pleckstrin-like domain